MTMTFVLNHLKTYKSDVMYYDTSTVDSSSVAGVHDAGVPEAAVRWSADPDLPGRPRPAPLRLHQDLRTYRTNTRIYRTCTY